MKPDSEQANEQHEYNHNRSRLFFKFQENWFLQLWEKWMTKLLKLFSFPLSFVLAQKLCVINTDIGRNWLESPSNNLSRSSKLVMFLQEVTQNFSHGYKKFSNFHTRSQIGSAPWSSHGVLCFGELSWFTCGLDVCKRNLDVCFQLKVLGSLEFSCWKELFFHSSSWVLSFKPLNGSSKGYAELTALFLSFCGGGESDYVSFSLAPLLFWLVPDKRALHFVAMWISWENSINSTLKRRCRSWSIH